MTIFEKVVISSWLIMIMTGIITKWNDEIYGSDANAMRNHPIMLCIAVIFLSSIVVSFGGGCLCLLIRIWS